jgi:hypothetical protein
MWDSTHRWDLTRISSEELKEAEIDDSVRAVTNIKKKSIVPKVFGAVAFSKAFPRTKVCFFVLAECFFSTAVLLIRIECDGSFCSGCQHSSMLSAPTRRWQIPWAQFHRGSGRIDFCCSIAIASTGKEEKGCGH